MADRDAAGLRFAWPILHLGSRVKSVLFVSTANFGSARSEILRARGRRGCITCNEDETADNAVLPQYRLAVVETLVQRKTPHTALISIPYSQIRTRNAPPCSHGAVRSHPNVRGRAERPATIPFANHPSSSRNRHALTGVSCIVHSARTAWSCGVDSTPYNGYSWQRKEGVTFISGNFCWWRSCRRRFQTASVYGGDESGTWDGGAGPPTLLGAPHLLRVLEQQGANYFASVLFQVRSDDIQRSLAVRVFEIGVCPASQQQLDNRCVPVSV